MESKNTQTFKDIEFTFEEQVTQSVDSFQEVNIYVNVTITKGNNKYHTGYKLDQISLLCAIAFENNDGTENKGILTSLEIEEKGKNSLLKEYKALATKFAIGKNWEMVGESYNKMASLDNDPNNYILAANSYKKVNYVKAIDNFSKAIELYTKDKRYGMVAKYYKEIAELYENNNENKKSLESYQNAANYFEIDNKTVNANQCLIKVAELSTDNFEKSAKIFENAGIEALKSNLGSFSAKGYFLK